MADGDYYSVRVDLENMFGSGNIEEWSDAENERDPIHINNRIDWANKQSKVFIDARLARGPYDIPFDTGGGGTTPDVVCLVATLKAGIFLYDTRRITSAADPDRIAQQRLDYETMIKQILSGTLSIIEVDGTILTKNSKNIPFVASS